MERLKEKIIKMLTDCGLKITPQRMTVLEILLLSKNHPTAESVFKQVQSSLPGISATTIYNTLDTFVEKGLVKRVQTVADIMRYEPATEQHHHLYSAQSDRMEDYYDPELDELLMEYFRKKKIKNFNIHEITLQMTGDFTDKTTK